MNLDTDATVNVNFVELKGDVPREVSPTFSWATEGAPDIFHLLRIEAPSPEASSRDGSLSLLAGA